MSIEATNMKSNDQKLVNKTNILDRQFEALFIVIMIIIPILNNQHLVKKNFLRKCLIYMAILEWLNLKLINEFIHYISKKFCLMNSFL